MMTISPFLAALGSDGPPADRAKDMALYGWLIGSWEMDSVHYLDDGTIQKWDGECHFGWVLEGRAIQDVWIRPKRPAPSAMYGTTLRIFDPGIDGWHIIWNDPLNRDHSRQIGRAEGKDIVQLGNTRAVCKLDGVSPRSLPPASIGSARKDLPRAILGKSRMNI
ncbi:hypothetical protein [Mesorhizobium sp. M0684]|uniref:hypothetical protein n=1 Tax=Mesorhizobium sp. M0684 TaxID=2956986 RepID=UPI00333C0319